MLRPAQLFREIVQLKMQDCWYDPAYKYYFDDMPYTPDIPDDPDNQRDFVSIDNQGNVIGYLSYKVDRRIQGAFNFGIISFDIGNPIMGRDILQLLGDVFFKFNMNRAEFFAFEDNPVIKSYRKFIKRYGGNEVGTLHNAARGIDGKLHNCVIFEMCKSDLKMIPDGMSWYCRLANDTGYEAGMFWDENGVTFKGVNR